MVWVWVWVWDGMVQEISITGCLLCVRKTERENRQPLMGRISTRREEREERERETWDVAGIR